MKTLLETAPHPPPATQIVEFCDGGTLADTVRSGRLGARGSPDLVCVVRSSLHRPNPGHLRPVKPWSIHGETLGTVRKAALNVDRRLARYRRE
jgi:hypothetical protein